MQGWGRFWTQLLGIGHLVDQPKGKWVEPEPARDFNKRVIMFREVCVEKYSYILTSLGNISTSTTCALLNMQSLKEEILNIFEQIWTHLNNVQTHLSTIEHIRTHLNKFWTYLKTFEQCWNTFEHIWTTLNKFGTHLNKFYTHLNTFWAPLNTFEQFLNTFKQIWTHLNNV